MTVAIDTNILVRIATQDDESQLKRSQELLSSETGYVQKVVLLELVWTLRSSYRFSREQTLERLRAVLDSDNLILEDREQVAEAVDWYERGCDFPDALILAGAICYPVHTLDKGFCKPVRNDKGTPDIVLI